MKSLRVKTRNFYLFLIALILVSLSLTFIDYFVRTYFFEPLIAIFLGFSGTFCLLVIIKLNKDYARSDKILSGIFNLPAGIVICDNQDQILWLNRKAREILKLQETDKNLNLAQLLPENVLQDFFYGDKQPYTVNLELQPERFWVVACSRYSTRSSIISFREITETKKIEDDRKWMFSNVSHEFRIPLTVLQGYIEMLEDARKEQPYNKIDLTPYRHMQKQVNRLLSLVSQITTLNKIQVNKNWGQKILVDVPDIIYSIYEEVQLKNRKQNIFELHLDDELLVYAFENSLHAVIVNLIYNAIEHNVKKTHIDIYWHKVTVKEKLYACFAIKDNGIGIAPEHLKFLTQRFYVVSSDRNREAVNGSGSGLGLSIVDQALKAHKSSLKIDSKVGVGSCFSFLLPLDQEEPK